MTEKILKAKYGSPNHPLQIGDLEIPCYVLENGKRVLVQRAMMKSLDIKKGGNIRRKGEGDRLYRFVTGEIIKPFVPEKVIEATQEPIKFKTPGGYVYEVK